MSRELSAKHRRRAYWTVFSVAIAAASVFSYYLTVGQATAVASPQAPVPQVRVVKPAVEQVVEWDEFTGRFAAVDSVEIRAQVSGYLTEIAFAAGATVNAGDLLFRIDPRPYDAELRAAKADLAGALATLRVARDENERGLRLQERQAISQEAVDNRQRAVLVAEAAWAAAKARVDQAALNLDFTEIRAPVAGRVSDHYVTVGNLIQGGAQGGTVLTSLVSVNPIHFEFTASEAEVLKYLRLEQNGVRESGRSAQHPVRVKLADEESFSHEGVLTFVDNQFDPSTGTMRGRATLPNSDGLFSPGMFGRLQVAGSAEYEALLIPDSAVQSEQTSKYVWIATSDNEAQRRAVELGPLIDGLRVVRAGLDAADDVVVSGIHRIRPNATIVAERVEPAALQLAGVGAVDVTR